MSATRLINISLMRAIRVSSVLFGILTASVLWAAEHHGTVQSRGLPVPGATVTAIHNDQRMVTTTDEQGRYQFTDLPDGTWTLEVEMFGFAKSSREVGIAPGAPSPDWQLQMTPLNSAKREEPATPAVAANPGAPEAPRRAARAQAGPAAVPTPDRGGRPGFRQGGFRQGGFQQANVNAAANGATPAAEENPNGSASTENAFGDLNQSASDALVVNGSVSSGLNLPPQNDWFGIARGFDGFGPGGPAGFGPQGNLAGADGAGALSAAATTVANGTGGPAAGGRGGGPGGRGGGGFGGGGFGGGRGGRGGFGRQGRGPRNLNAFGNGRRDRRRQYNGNVALILDNSALDARSYSLTGQQTPKPAYARFRTTGMFGGPLKIPHLVSGQNTFFTINYQLSRNRNANTLSALVPTDAEKNGDFTGAVNQITGKPITLTGFAGNLIPASQISPQAQALLNWYPAPNFSGNPRYNYQIPVISVTDQNNVNVRLNHTINSKNQINGNFAWQNSSGSTPNVFGFVDTT